MVGRIEHRRFTLCSSPVPVRLQPRSGGSQGAASPQTSGRAARCRHRASPSAMLDGTGLASASPAPTTARRAGTTAPGHSGVNPPGEAPERLPPPPHMARVHAWLPGCLVAWLPGCLVAWLPGCLVAWLPGCLVAGGEPHRVSALFSVFWNLSEQTQGRSPQAPARCAVGNSPAVRACRAVGELSTGPSAKRGAGADTAAVLLRAAARAWVHLRPGAPSAGGFWRPAGGRPRCAAGGLVQAATAAPRMLVPPALAGTASAPITVAMLALPWPNVRSPVAAGMTAPMPGPSYRPRTITSSGATTATCAPRNGARTQ
jgi:hypothetical protein